MIILAEI